jgi:hypothetical protein
METHTNTVNYFDFFLGFLTRKRDTAHKKQGLDNVEPLSGSYMNKPRQLRPGSRAQARQVARAVPAD